MTWVTGGLYACQVDMNTYGQPSMLVDSLVIQCRCGASSDSQQQNCIYHWSPAHIIPFLLYAGNCPTRRGL